MDVCTVEYQGDKFAFARNPISGVSFWYNKKTNLAVHLYLAQELKATALNSGIPKESFVTPVKTKATTGTSEPRIRTKIKLFKPLS